jgi:transcriptional regulator with XRE-family HTH domain
MEHVQTLGESLKKKDALNHSMKSAFSNRLFQAMKAKGYTVKQVSEACECSSVMVGKYLAGGSFPSQSTLELIGNCLSVTPAWLLYGDDLTRVVDKGLMVEIFAQLHGSISESDDLNKYKRMIQFALEIYEMVHPLEMSDLEKQKLITKMVQSVLSVHG